MGKEDSALKAFFRDNHRFADLFNQSLFGGKPVIDPQKLRDMDTAGEEIVPLKDGRTTVIQKSRDVVKRYNDEVALVVLGVENQHQVHYAMPARVMIYDALSYERQCKEIARAHQKRKDLKSSEWISQFAKTDHLMPVITLVIYYGLKPWDGPRNLSDMFVAPASFKKFAGNYPMHLVEVNAIKDVEGYADDLMALFAFVKYQRELSALAQVIERRKAYFGNMSQEVYAVIKNIVDVKQMDHLVKKEITEEGGINMCEALEQLKNEGIQIGEARGRRKVARQLLKRNHPIPDVAEITELSEMEVEKIKREI